ncbi:hypothetical protein OROGR_006692 [Orobanche gracilis]
MELVHNKAIEVIKVSFPMSTLSPKPFLSKTKFATSNGCCAKEELPCEVKEAQQKKLEELKKQQDVHNRLAVERKLFMRNEKIKFFESEVLSDSSAKLITQLNLLFSRWELPCEVKEAQQKKLEELKKQQDVHNRLAVERKIFMRN